MFDALIELFVFQIFVIPRLCIHHSCSAQENALASTAAPEADAKQSEVAVGQPSEESEFDPDSVLADAMFDEA